MSDDKFVKQYMMADVAAANAEEASAKYRDRAEVNRWEQCRIAHEAVDSGEYTRRSFARAVGKSDNHIGVQFKVWAAWCTSDARPSYTDAYDQAQGRTWEDRKSDTIIGRTRSLPAGEKAKLARELLEDDAVAEEAMTSARTRQRAAEAAERGRARSVPDPEYRPTRGPAAGAGSFGMLAAEGKLNSQLRVMQRAAAEAIEIAGEATFTADIQEELLERTQRIRAALDFLDTAIASGRVDVDQALADLLEGGDT